MDSSAPLPVRQPFTDAVTIVAEDADSNAGGSSSLWREALLGNKQAASDIADLHREFGINSSSAAR